MTEVYKRTFAMLGKEERKSTVFLLCHDLFIFDGHNKIICQVWGRSINIISRVLLRKHIIVRTTFLPHFLLNLKHQKIMRIFDFLSIQKIHKKQFIVKRFFKLVAIMLGNINRYSNEIQQSPCTNCKVINTFSIHT